MKELLEKKDYFKEKLIFEDTSYTFFSLEKMEQKYPKIKKLPTTLKILLEAALRNLDNKTITQKHLTTIINWEDSLEEKHEIPFKPSRILLQDFTGIPVIVDLAALRAAIKAFKKDPKIINPKIPVDLVVDHSLIVAKAGTEDSLEHNIKLEFSHNKERYSFLKWAQESFENLRIIPPANGIVHQVNLEYLATVVTSKKENNENILLPDSLIGTDSHTTMINSLGILGFGVGGIEAEACMLNKPLYFCIPEVVGVKLTGSLREFVTATDIALTITEILRKENVVGKFVEFYGPGLDVLKIQDRATIANMAPEYGATVGFFPIDNITLEYLLETGRKKEDIKIVEEYTKKQQIFRNDEIIPNFTKTIEIKLQDIQPSIAGPKRPQDRIVLSEVKNKWQKLVLATEREKKVKLNAKETLQTGSIVLAAITSCTNTSNPYVMIGAGILAKKAVEKGLRVPSFVKCSLTPGSTVVTKYLQKAGLLAYLSKLKFNIAGYGCATCIGNSGPLAPTIEQAIKENNLLVVSVLSGNRNFEGRIHPLVKANFLASPILVVAYALAGTIAIDFEKEPLGTNEQNEKIYLKDIFPKDEEITKLMEESITTEQFKEQYAKIFTNKEWDKINVKKSSLYAFDEKSTYIQEPPFFKSIALTKETKKRDFKIKLFRLKFFE